MNGAPLQCASVAHQHHHRSPLLPLAIFFAACAASAVPSTAAAGSRTIRPIYATIIKFQTLDTFSAIFESIAGGGCRELVVEFSGTQFSWHGWALSEFLRSGCRELIVELSGTQFSWHDLASSEVRELAVDSSGTQCFVA